MVLATEPPDSQQPQQTQPSEPEEIQPEETEPEETEPEETEPQAQDLTGSVLVTWHEDSALTYEVEPDDFSWEVYDDAGNATVHSGLPASAGYAFTGEGEWFGNVMYTITVENQLTHTAQLRFLFTDGLSRFAQQIISTMEVRMGSALYDPDTGVLEIEQESTAVLTITVDAQVFNEAQVELDREKPMIGAIQVQVEEAENVAHG